LRRFSITRTGLLSERSAERTHLDSVGARSARTWIRERPLIRRVLNRMEHALKADSLLRRPLRSLLGRIIVTSDHRVAGSSRVGCKTRKCNELQINCDPEKEDIFQTHPHSILTFEVQYCSIESGKARLATVFIYAQWRTIPHSYRLSGAAGGRSVMHPNANHPLP
jgi:hypothetical protein